MLRNRAVAAAVLSWLVFLIEETRAPLSAQPISAEGHVDRILLSQAWAEARSRVPRKHYGQPPSRHRKLDFEITL
jgi:hypothetical protein